MPLMHGKSKKAFEHNVKAEMDAGKPQAQSLAIAYDIKRKNKKKYAKGGMVNESAASEHRPMPEERDKDAAMVSRNSSMKALPEDKWTDSPTVKQAQKPSITKLSRPKIANGILKVKDRDDAEAEEHMMSSMAPASPKEQPAKELDEEGAKRQGPSVPALKMKMMAEGGMINKAVSMKRAEEDRVEHPAGLEEDDDQMRPAMSDYMSEHDAAQFAEGGMAHEMDMQPEPEAEEEHHASIAAAIMAKKERQKRLMSDSDEDSMVMMADGGILSHDSIYSDDSSQADLSRNADEDANEEDQLSFNALRKENYSESEGLRQLDSPMDSNLHGDQREEDEENKHDMISAIRSKMSRQRQFKKA